MAAPADRPELPDRGTCEATGKRRFTHDEAVKVAKSTRRNGRTGRRTKVHEFHCTGPLCDWWHVGGQGTRR